MFLEDLCRRTRKGLVPRSKLHVYMKLNIIQRKNNQVLIIIMIRRKYTCVSVMVCKSSGNLKKKAIIRVSDQVRHKPCCTATEDG